MELQDYCHNVEIELAGWKAELYTVLRKIDRLGTAERQKILPVVEDLHILMEDMEGRIQQLRTECATEWSPTRKEMGYAHVDMRGNYDETMEFIGKAAPVSVGG